MHKYYRKLWHQDKVTYEILSINICKNVWIYNIRTFIYALLIWTNSYSANSVSNVKEITRGIKTDRQETVNMGTRTKSFIYFSQLSKQQVSKLYQMYAFDFKLFNYDVKGYGEINQIV